jgi:hypothetical protein
VKFFQDKESSNQSRGESRQQSIDILLPRPFDAH